MITHSKIYLRSQSTPRSELYKTQFLTSIHFLFYYHDRSKLHAFSIRSIKHFCARNTSREPIVRFEAAFVRGWDFILKPRMPRNRRAELINDRFANGFPGPANARSSQWNCVTDRVIVKLRRNFPPYRNDTVFAKRWVCNYCPLFDSLPLEKFQRMPLSLPFLL